MESVVNGSVLGVSSRPISNGRTIYEVAVSDGNTYTTFKPDVAQKAANVQGQQASILVAVTQTQKNGQTYTNFYINDVGPVGSLVAANASQGQPIPGQQIVPQGGISGPGVIQQAPSQGGGRKGWTEEDTKRVTRQWALGTAFEFVGDLMNGAGPEAIEQGTALALTLAADLYQKGIGKATAEHGSVAAQPAQVAEPLVPTTPQEVAQQVEGVEVGTAAVAATGDDLPWD